MHHHLTFCCCEIPRFLIEFTAHARWWICRWLMFSEIKWGFCFKLHNIKKIINKPKKPILVNDQFYYHANFHFLLAVIRGTFLYELKSKDFVIIQLDFVCKKINHCLIANQVLWYFVCLFMPYFFMLSIITGPR